MIIKIKVVWVTFEKSFVTAPVNHIVLSFR